MIDRPPTAPAGRTLIQLQVVRAVAALIVVAFHAQGELRHRGLADPLPDLTVGAFGVDLFFVVSGFIMVFASRRLFGRAGEGVPFMVRRLARIVPLYWAFTVLYTFVAMALARLPGHPQASIFHIVTSFLFLPSTRPEDGAFLPVYALGWTLNYEMFFYLCFAAAIGFRLHRAVVAMTVGMVGLVAVGRSGALPWPFAYWADPISLEFVFGLWIGVAFLAGHRLPSRIGIPLSLAAIAAVMTYAPHLDAQPAWRGLAWGLPATVIVATALGFDSAGTSWAARAATRLGDASYSLYLVHSALFIGLYAVLSRIVDVGRLPSLAYAALLVVASIAAALLLFRVFERPATRRLHREIDGRLARPAGKPGVQPHP